MSKWVGVVEHSKSTNDRIGETLINLDNVVSINTAFNVITFAGSEENYIVVNKESIIHLLEIIETA